jgi:hypothetical protein
VTNNIEIAKWSSAYELPQRIKAHPSQQALVQSTIIAKASVFEAYVGAVFSESGLPLVSFWLKRLIRRVLELEDNRTPKSELSPLSKRDSDIGTDDMAERILFRQVDALSIAPTTSTAVRTGPEGYRPPVNEFRNRPIAPSTNDGSLDTPCTPSTSFMDAAHAQPMPVATGRPSPLRHEIQPGRFSPNFGLHSPSHLYPPISQYTEDVPLTTHSYDYEHSQRSPPFRSNSSSTVRPPATRGSSHDSPSPGPNTNTSPLRPPPSLTSSNSSSDSPGSGYSQASTKSVAGGYLALFNQMATQKKEKVEWKMSSSGPPHKPKFEAQVIGKSCRLIVHALMVHQLAQSVIVVMEGVKP